MDKEPGAKKDESALSLPSSNKFTIKTEDGEERNFTAKRVPLAERIRLAKFFSGLLSLVADGEDLKLNDMGNPDKLFSLVLRKLPTMLKTAGDGYQGIVLGCTNMDIKFLEHQVEIDDLVIIFKHIFIANNFHKTIQKFKEEQAQGKKK